MLRIVIVRPIAPYAKLCNIDDFLITMLLLNSSVDQRRLESANLTLCRWISGYDYG